MRPVLSNRRSVSASPGNCASRGFGYFGVLRPRSAIPLRLPPSGSDNGSSPGARRRGCAKCCDLDDVASEIHVSQTEPPPNEAAVAEQLAHLFRQRVGCNVKILRLNAKQQVAHAAAHEECLKAPLAQSIQDTQRVRRNTRTGNRVFGARNDPGSRGGRLAQDAAGEFKLRFFRLEQLARAPIIPRSSALPSANAPIV